MLLSKPISKQIAVLLVASVFSTGILADSFVVQKIQVQGLQRVSTGTVLRAMPVHVGETYTDTDGEDIINAVFETGFFSRVNLTRSGNTLIVNVVERPTIDSINITGNKAIKADQLKPVLKKMGIVVGYTYDPSQLHAIVAGLQQQYALMGHPGAIVTPTVKDLPRNQVAINISIQEGKPSLVNTIKITGNKAFSEHELISQFKMTTPGILTWFTHTDRFSQTHLEEDLQHLQDFYYDHGYLQFRVLSQSVTPVPKTNNVAIAVTVFEGPVYHISGYQLDAKLPNDLVPSVKKIISVLKVGQVFSRKQVVAINKQIADYLGDHGYAFPLINPTPQLNQATHQVFLNYLVSANNRMYVRKIHILGNERTSELVVRSQLRQMEGGVYSLKNVNESKRLMSNLPYLNNINVTTTPVPNTNNQLDLDYHVHEVSAGRASVQGGYSDVEGFLYGASVSEPNFMGSGKLVSIGFQNSQYQNTYNFTYNNPFYTTTGISRAFNIYYSHVTPAQVNMAPYTMNDVGGSMTYGIPMSEYDTLALGAGYDYVTISNVNTSEASPNVTDFLSKYPSPYNNFKLITGLSHSTLDRAIFPTEGDSQSLNLTAGVPVIDSSLAYYQAVYNGTIYFPIGAGFIINPNTTLGYGGGYGDTASLPFFDNFYAGGIHTLPGYVASSLGPRNPNNNTQAIGGNIEALAGVNFILPDFISNKVRTGLFLDAGNIYETQQTPGITYEANSLNNLRLTTGLMVSWMSPLGAPLDFSLGFPLNQKPGDDPQIFGFSFGAMF